MVKQNLEDDGDKQGPLERKKKKQNGKKKTHELLLITGALFLSDPVIGRS